MFYCNKCEEWLPEPIVLTSNLRTSGGGEVKLCLGGCGPSAEMSGKNSLEGEHELAIQCTLPEKALERILFKYTDDFRNHQATKDTRLLLETGDFCVYYDGEVDIYLMETIIGVSLQACVVHNITKI